jgi:hypothetical protein
VYGSPRPTHCHLDQQCSNFCACIHNNNTEPICPTNHSPQRCRRRALNGTKCFLPICLYPHDLLQRSCLQRGLYELSERCCELHDCVSEWGPGRYHQCAEWRRDNHCCAQCWTAERAEHLCEFERTGVFCVAGRGVPEFWRRGEWGRHQGLWWWLFDGGWGCRGSHGTDVKMIMLIRKRGRDERVFIFNVDNMGNAI